nr:salicylate carboxymethyltransferase [Quercus suber]
MILDQDLMQRLEIQTPNGIRQDSEEEKVDSFNIPTYTPSLSELKFEVLKGGDFSIDRLEHFEANRNIYDGEFNTSNGFRNDDEHGVAKHMRAVAEPWLVTYFGVAIIDEVFHRYGKITDDHISKEKTQFISLTISVTKKG